MKFATTYRELSTMHLLVSVSDPDEASAALSGGADIIDAKNPLAGPLGAVDLEVLRAIHVAVGAERPLTAALGDATDADRVEADARAFTRAGAMLVKIGFAGLESADGASELLGRALRGAAAGARDRSREAWVRPPGVVAVAYADADRAASVPADAILDAAIHAGVQGVLLDTFDKRGQGLRDLVTLDTLIEWVGRARRVGLLVALAGRLEAADLEWVREAGADVAGVRGAACDGGRAGRITSDRVRALRWLCDGESGLAGRHLRAAAAPPGAI